MEPKKPTDILNSLIRDMLQEARKCVHSNPANIVIINVEKLELTVNVSQPAHYSSS